MQTGYVLVDGDPARGIGVATPRHWAICAGLVIVAQWALGSFSSFTSAATGFFFRIDSGLMSESQLAFSSTAWLIFPYAIVAGITIWLSRRIDGRGPEALGLQRRAVAEGAPWIVAGFAASFLTIISFFRLSAGWEGQALAALPWLIPATLIQSGAEEIMFRGALLSMLVARYGARNGALISAALFALWHLYAGQGLVDASVYGVTTFIFGVTGAILVLHQGHLGGAIALHFTWNLIGNLDAGLDGATSYSGILGMFGAEFWQSFIANISNAFTYEDFTSGDIVRDTIAPLIFETLIVLAVCRLTFEKLISASEASNTKDAIDPTAPTE